jgi:hypothetical protein
MCYLNGFGELHPEKYFYVIRQPGVGRGLFSLYSSVLCHLHLADKHGLIPIVDFKNFNTEYNDADVTETLNAWEYYFCQVTNVSLVDIYKSKNVFLSDPWFPRGYPMSITNMAELRATADKYIAVRPGIIESAMHFYESAMKGYRVLGVHFRGQEMKTAPFHGLPPTKRQLVEAIRRAMAAEEFERIFVVSEDAGYVEFLKQQFGRVVIYSDHYRTFGANAYRVRPRRAHKYILGREILEDTILLSRCNGFIGCTSNVAEAAIFMNAGQFSYLHRIDNGPNSGNPFLAKYLWTVKSLLPSNLGGFRLQGPYEPRFSKKA